MERNRCSLCLENVDSSAAMTNSCRHAFCHSCLREWTKNHTTCPLDKTPFDEALVSEHAGGSGSQKEMCKRNVEQAGVQPSLAATLKEIGANVTGTLQAATKILSQLRAIGSEIQRQHECVQPSVAAAAIELGVHLKSTQQSADRMLHQVRIIREEIQRQLALASKRIQYSAVSD